MTSQTGQIAARGGLISRAGAALLCLTMVSVAVAQKPADDTLGVVIKTELGDIEVELNAKQAPKTVENFLRYVDAKLYDGGRFHRTVKLDNQPGNKIKIEVIQAGTAPERAKEDLAPIKLERTSETKLLHIDGAISMARDGPDTATSDFFICIDEQKELDFGGKRNPDGQGFAAFGKVTKGMEIVKKIQAAPEKEQTLMPPVKILSVRRKGELTLGNFNWNLPMAFVTLTAVTSHFHFWDFHVACSARRAEEWAFARRTR